MTELHTQKTALKLLADKELDLGPLTEFVLEELINVLDKNTPITILVMTQVLRNLIATEPGPSEGDIVPSISHEHEEFLLTSEHKKNRQTELCNQYQKQFPGIPYAFAIKKAEKLIKKEVLDDRVNQFTNFQKYTKGMPGYFNWNVSGADFTEADSQILIHNAIEALDFLISEVEEN